MFAYLYLMMLNAKVKVQRALTDERGDVNVVAIVVLIAVAVMLALLLKDQLTQLITDLIGGITDKANTILE